MLFFLVKQCHGVEVSRCQGVGINNVLVCIKLFIMLFSEIISAMVSRCQGVKVSRCKYQQCVGLYYVIFPS